MVGKVRQYPTLPTKVTYRQDNNQAILTLFKCSYDNEFQTTSFDFQKEKLNESGKRCRVLSAIYGHLTSTIPTAASHKLLAVAISTTVRLTLKIKLIRKEYAELRQM